MDHLVSCTALSLLRQSASKRKAWQQLLPSLCNGYEINGADNWYIIIKIPSCGIKRAKPSWHMHAHPYSVMSGNRPNIVAESNRVNPTGFVPPKLHFNVKYICVSLSHYLIAHLCLAVHTFPQLQIQLKFRFSKSLSQQLLPLHRPQLSLQFLFIQIILSPAVHCPSIAQEGHFKSLSLHSWITGQEKSILNLRLNIITQKRSGEEEQRQWLPARAQMQPPFYRWNVHAPKTVRGSLSYRPLQALFDFSFTIQNPDGNVSN